MGKAAELIVAKPGMSRTKSLTIFAVQGFIYHWTSSLQATLDPLLEGYRIGLDIGDNECAGLCCEFKELLYLCRCIRPILIMLVALKWGCVLPISFILGALYVTPQWLIPSHCM